MLNYNAVLRSRIGKAALAVVSLATLVAVPLLGAGGIAAAGAPDDGETLFQARCAACHTVGGGPKAGPDLQGVAERRSGEWLKRWLVAPDRMLADKDPTAIALLAQYNNVPMPNLGLTEADAASLIAYFEAQPRGAVSPPAPSGATAGLPEGDSVRGEHLFTGPARFRNRGPSCAACHSSSGVGALGGGTLGRDLTESYGRLGDAMITWPETVLPMRAIYANKPLTDREKADLLAFFRSADVAASSTATSGLLAGVAAAGAAAIAILAQLIWRRRLRNVRRTMVGAPAPQRGRWLLIAGIALALAVNGAGLGVIVATVT